MKRKFTLLITAIMFVMTSLAWGQVREEVVAYTLDGTITGGSNGYATESEITQNGMTWMVTGNTTMNPWRIGGKNLSGEDRPLYSTSAMSDNITKVVVTNGSATATVNSMKLYVSSSSDFSNSTVVTGSFTATDSTTFERPANADWTNKYFKLVYNITAGGSNQYAQFVNAKFYKNDSGGTTQTVATPTFSPAAGTYYEAQNVTITCATEGATIYYTTDGTDPIVEATVAAPSPTYTHSIAISQTTTLKAVAVMQGMNNSAVATAEYTISEGPSVIPIADARTLQVNEYAWVQGVVTFIDGRNVYVQDSTAGIDLYLNSTVSTLNLGDMVLAYGKRALYNGLVELSGIDPNDQSQFVVLSSGNPLPVAGKTLYQIVTDYQTGANTLQSTRVQIDAVTVDSINTNANSIISQGEYTLNVYKMPVVEGLVKGDVVGVTGVVGCFNAPQLRVALASDVVKYQQITDPVPDPVFAPEAGTYTNAVTVTITCSQEGATIYYTLDGSDPIGRSSIMNGMEYTQPFTIDTTTTVKAIAVKQGMLDSNVVTATYTIETGPQLMSIAEARSLALNEYALLQGVVTFIDGRNIYVQDASAGIDLYLNNNTVPSNLALGDEVQAYGKRATFKGLAELSDINGNDSTVFKVVSTGNNLPVAVKTIAEINADATGNNMLQSTRVKIVDARVGEIKNNGNTYVSQNQDSLNIYKMPVVQGLAEGDSVTVIGVLGCYNTVQLRVASAEDVTFTHPQLQTVATPTFTPEGGDFTEEISVTIACATEGATIYYTLDGSDPVTPNGIMGTEYTDPIVLNDTTMVKAVAIKQGMEDSQIAEAVYNINILPPAQETVYKLITHTNALINGDKYIIVGMKNDSVYVAMGKQANNNRPAVDVMPVGDSITVIPANQAGMDAVYEFTLGQEDGKWTLYDAVYDGYLYAASSSVNQLKTQAQNNANGQWAIEFDANGVATIKAQGTNTRNWMRYNSSNNIFSCYGSGQLDVYLYKAGDVPTPPAPTYYSVAVADSIANGTVTVNKETALENDTIVVTAVADGGYELTALTYNVIGAEPVSIIETGQFLMPAANVTVNATFTELAHVATPTFTPAAGSYITAQTVSISCATEGATIYYTLDGSNPTPNSPVYSEAFAVEATTTVKAIAAKGGMNDSDVASATYTIIELMSISDAKVLENNQYALVQGVVTFIDSRNIYVQDSTSGIDLYLNNNTVPSNLAVGDLVMAYGKKTVYNGLIELTGINGGDANQFVILSNDNELPLAVKTIAEIVADHNGSKLLQSTRVQVVEATIGAINTNGNTPLTQDESTVNIYKIPVVEGLEQGDIVTVIGIVGCYNNPQLRVALASDVTYTHPAGIFVNPTSLSGFTYVYEEGPSTIQTFNISARSLSAATHLYAPESYEMSSFPGENFNPEDHITINTYTGVYNYTIKVRLKAGLEVGDYNESIMVCESEVDTIYIALSGSVTDSPLPPQPQPGSDYGRVTDLSQIGNGSKVIFAARFNENVNEYYAMTATASGKPEGVLFTSVTGETAETLPAEIADAEDTYYWTVATDGTNYTFTNAAGDVLGYTSGTNFATGGDNTNWTIETGTSDAAAMVPDYNAFVITNANVTGRAFALNSYHNFGPYAKSNMTGSNAASYNFLIDMFITAGGTVTPTCAAPTFEPVGGTYFEEQTVTIECSTADATIYYTLDGSDPTPNSLVYTEPIEVAESMTIKAYAVKDGYNDSNIVEAEYTIILGAVTIFYQDWEGEMNGWTFVTVEGIKPWTIASYSGNHYANANGYNGGVNEQWCISPAFNLNMYENETLTFRNAMKFTGPDMEVFFSNDYDGEDPTTATWTPLEYVMSEGNYVWAESGPISLENFEGTNCYIGFKYTSTETEAASWEIDDIMLIGFTSDAVLTVTPLSLSFTYTEGFGPSAEQSFLVSGFNLTENVVISNITEEFEISDMPGEDFDPMEDYEIEPYNGTIEEVIYVRMAEGLTAGNYDGSVIVSSELENQFVTLSGTVNEPIVSGDWTRIGSLEDLHDGDQIIIASRYDATVGDGYYAMTAAVSGKPEGVLFSSINENGAEILPDAIVAEIATFMWTVTLEDGIITLTNANGDAIGYSSSTNFSGNTSTEWNIAYETAGETGLLPNYSGFVITNVETTNRGFAKNSNNNFGAYSTSNMSNADYNFYLDLFVLGGSATQTVATPVFSVASGTYFEEFDVEISCATEGATIYYTTDGSDPTAESTVYEEAIHVDQDMTLKAIAMLDGYENSNIATANYELITGQIVILNQDWEGEMNGWTFVTVEGNKPWSIGTYGGNKYAYANGYNDDIDNEHWCISPSFDLTYYTDVVLTFRNAMKFTGPDMQLMFSTDYDGEHISAATWTELDYVKSEGNYVWTESGEISLDGLRASNCHLAFLYTSFVDDGAAAWEVDDILVLGTAYDAVEETEVTDVSFWNFGNEIFFDNQTNGNVQMTVFNMLGQQVFAKTLSTGSVRFSHNLATGLYVVTLQNSKGRMAVKMIVR